MDQAYFDEGTYAHSYFIIMKTTNLFWTFFIFTLCKVMGNTITYNMDITQCSLMFYYSMMLPNRCTLLNTDYYYNYYYYDFF